MFVLREAFRSIQRSPLSALVIALVIGVGLGLTAVFGFVAYSADRALDERRARSQPLTVQISIQKMR